MWNGGLALMSAISYSGELTAIFDCSFFGGVLVLLHFARLGRRSLGQTHTTRNC